MANVTIETIVENELYEVNGKPIRVEADGRWISEQIFSPQEQKAIYEFQKQINAQT
jgi:hypothetical protein